MNTEWVERYTAAAQNAVQSLDVPLEWVLAVIGAESSYEAPERTWEPAAGEYSYGPMQILASTARDRGFTGNPEELLIPETGIYYGAAQLAWLVGRYGRNYAAVISAYNEGHADPVAGAGYIARVTGWLEGLPDRAAAAVEDNQGALGMIAAGLLLMWLAWRLPPSPNRRRF